MLFKLIILFKKNFFCSIQTLIEFKVRIKMITLNDSFIYENVSKI